MADVTKICTKCGKKFLIIEPEQEFLAKKRIPLPDICPFDRQAKRREERGEERLFRTVCQNCGENIITSYDPDKTKRKILCRKCLLAYFDKNDGILP